MVGAPTHPVMPNLVVLWKMSPAWQREAGGPYNPGKMAVAARSPEFSNPTEMPRDLAGWGSARRAPWRLPRASISRPQSRTSIRRTQINAAPVRPNAYHVADLQGPERIAVLLLRVCCLLAVHLPCTKFKRRLHRKRKAPPVSRSGSFSECGCHVAQLEILCHSSRTCLPRS